VSLAAVGGVALAGAVGAPARYLVDGLVQDRTEGPFPWGTLVINLTGSLLLGLITGAALYHALPKLPRLWLGTGFCGAYTTFSTFTFETVELLESGERGTAVAYAAASLITGLAAAAAGLALAAAV
jgi:CrcB protein